MNGTQFILIFSLSLLIVFLSWFSFAPNSPPITARGAAVTPRSTPATIPACALKGRTARLAQTHARQTKPRRIFASRGKADVGQRGGLAKVPLEGAAPRRRQFYNFIKYTPQPASMAAPSHLSNHTSDVPTSGRAARPVFAEVLTRAPAIAEAMPALRVAREGQSKFDA